MKSSLLTLSFLVANAVALPRNSPDKFAACKAAPNCETFEDPKHNRTMIRFKKDMGPDSDWYHQNIRVHDKHHPLNKRNPNILQKRDDETHSNMDRSLETINFGTNNVVDAVNSMYDNCGASTCNEPWDVETEVLNADGATVSGAILAITATGNWDGTDPDNKAYFIDALKAQASPSSEQDNYEIVVDAYNSDDEYYNFYVGPQNIGINRYINGALQGYASVSIELITADTDLCDTVTGLLGTAIDTVSGIGGGFFGIFGDLFCDSQDGKAQTQ